MVEKIKLPSEDKEFYLTDMIYTLIDKVNELTDEVNKLKKVDEK